MNGFNHRARRASQLKCLKLPPLPPTQAASKQFSNKTSSSNLMVDLRAACRAGNLPLAQELFRLSPDLEAANPFWREVVKQDIRDGTSHWRSYAWLRL
jgi:hypothetical protein